MIFRPSFPALHVPRAWRPLLVALLIVGGAAPVHAQQESEDDLAFLEELERAFRRGGTYAAQRDLDEYLIDFPESPGALTIAAAAALGRGRLEAAENLMRRLPDPDPRLLGALLLRAGRYEEALELGRRPETPPLPGAVLRTVALDGLGRRLEARQTARDVLAATDDAGLTGLDMLDYGKLLVFLREYELANQALVFADADLNGKQGPRYRVNEAEVLVLLAQVFSAARQTTGGGDKALAVLDDVLEVDPGDPDALVAKARAFEYGFNGRLATAALAKALARDPGHPGALELLGRQHLLARRADDAIAAADQILSDNPRHRGALALRAAALTVAARPDAVRAREAFESAHPESAAYLALVGEVMQSYYRFADSIAPLEAALALEPDDESPLSVLAQSLAHVGRESEARAALEEHTRRSPYPFPWRANMLAVLRSLEDSVEVSTPDGFRLRLPPGEQDVTGVVLAEALAAARLDMAERWGVDPEDEVLVEVFDHHADFSVRTVGFSGFGALGACFGNLFTMLSPICELRGGFHWHQTALHEYAHVVTLALSRSRVPRWLTEGISVVEEKKFDPSWARPMERDVLDARANGMVPPLEFMDSLFRDGSTIGLGYYLGSLVAEVVEAEYGFDGLRDLVAAYGDDLSTGDAIRRALGVEPETVDAALLAYIDEVVAARAVLAPRYNEEGKERLRQRVSAGDDAALLELSRAYIHLGQLVDADGAMDRYLRGHEHGPAVDRVLAEADLGRKAPGAALEKLRHWAAAGEPDYDGLRLLGLLLIDEGESDEAIAALMRARALYPADVAADSATRLLLQIVDAEDDAGPYDDLLLTVVSHDELAWPERVMLAEQSRAAGDLEGARRWYGDLVDIDPYRPRMRMDYAEVLVESGDREAARRQWELVLGMRAEQVPGDAPRPEGGESGGGGLLGHLQGLMGGPGSSLEEIQNDARRRLQETSEGTR